MFSMQQITAADLARLLWKYRTRWLVPTVAVSAIAAAYALVRPDSWEASQALIVRNEATTTPELPGKFRQIDDMKVTQETILALAKSRDVLAATLSAVGPPADRKAKGEYPSPREIAALRKVVKLAPPKGTEFGKTEVFYLKVRSTDRARAIALTAALSEQLQAGYQKVLDHKAQSMEHELVDNVTVAEARLREASGELSKLEREVGQDLAELRILHSNPSGDSDMRLRAITIENDIRKYQTQQRAASDLRNLLVAAAKDPTHLIAAPNSLLESQPALKRLKEGLIDAQLKTALAMGSMTADHPTVKSAALAEAEIHRRINNELSIAIRGLDGDLQLNASQIEMLQKQLDDTRDRLTRLANLRADYSNLVTDVEHANKRLEVARTTLADARAKQTGARNSNLISRLEAPDGGTEPVGPGRAVTALLGVAAGLVIGRGVLILTVPALPTTGTDLAVATETTVTRGRPVA
ncbi:MAG: Wzz/FepE/Etk N-terminal domain-containing protein, partial [Pirellulales bacterium]